MTASMEHEVVEQYTILPEPPKRVRAKPEGKLRLYLVPSYTTIARSEIVIDTQIGQG